MSRPHCASVYACTINTCTLAVTYIARGKIIIVRPVVNTIKKIDP